MAKKKTVLLFSKRHAKAKEACKKLTAWLTKQGYPTLDVTDGEGRIERSQVKDVVQGVVIGGEGAFLTLVRRVDEKTAYALLCINSGTL